MRVMVLLLALASAFALAADNAVIAPQSAVSHKSLATTYGAESITIPQMLSYQGKLTDTLGVPVANGNYPMMFLLYSQPSGGSSFWSENQSVTTKDGLFSVLLGSATPIGSMPDAGTVYLAMTVSGGPELTPRIRIASSAFAYLSGRAANADLLQGKDTAALASAGHNHDAAYVNEGQASSVTSNMMVDGTIAAVDLSQMGASSGQVMKWNGSAWTPANDSVGQSSGGTVRKVFQSAGVVLSPNPITDSGTVRFDTTWGDARFVNEAQAAGGDLNGTYPSPTLATSGVTSGTYGSATQVGQFAVDAKGRLTSAGNVSISGVPPGGTAGGALAGTYPNPTIASDSVTSAKILDGTVAAADLAATGVSAGTYGSATQVSQVTVNTKGQVTSASNVAISGVPPGGSAGGDLTGTYPNPTLVTSGVTSGTYGSATQVGQFAVDAKGRLTSTGNVTIAGVPPGGAAGGGLTGTYPNPTIAADAVSSGNILDGSVTSADIRDTTVNTADVKDAAVTMPKLNQAGATTGQVIKWNGSAWAPRNDSLGGSVTSVSQATGVVCSPNPITTTGTVSFDSTWGDARFVNESQSNSITGAMITDGQVSSADIRDTTITTAKLKDDAVTSAKVLDGSITSADIRDTTVNTADLKDAAVTAPKLNQMGATSGQVIKWTGSAWAPGNDSVGTGGSGTVRKVFQSTGVVLLPNPISDSGTVGFDTTWGDARFVNENQANSVTGAMITDGQVSSADMRDTTVTTAKLKDAAITASKLGQMGASSGQVMKWTGSVWSPANDSVGTGGSGTVRKVFQSTGVVLSPDPITDSGTVRFDTTWGDARFVNEAQAAGGGLTGTYPNPTIAADAVSSGNIVDGSVTSADIRDTTVNTADVKDAAITAPKLNQMGATSGQVLKWTGAAWAPANDSGGIGTVRKVFQSTGVVLSPNPITDSGTVRFDSTWGDARFVNEAQAAGGDLTGTYPSPTLASSGVSAGIYGSATQVGQFAVDAKGRLTSAGNVTITGVPPGGAAGGGLTGTYPNPTIAADAVSSANIVDGSVTSADIRDTTVTTADVKDDAITSAKILDGAVTSVDIRDTTVNTADLKDAAVTMPKLNQAGASSGQVIKWTGSAWAPANDSSSAGTMRKVVQSTGIICSPNPMTDSGTVGFDSTWGDARFVNEAQANSITGAMIVDGTVSSADIRDTTVNTADLKDGAVTSAKVLDGSITSADIRDTTVNTADIKDAAVTAPKLNQMGATSGQVLKWTGSAWAPTNDSLGSGDSAWVRQGSDSVLYTIRNLGIARAGNTLYGVLRYGHTNLGVACTTGMNGYNYAFATVGGGYANTASAPNATVGGGYNNTASAQTATVAGGYTNIASGTYAMVGGGYNNTASGSRAYVGGGQYNVATDSFATVGGGRYDSASAKYATVAGGYTNIASGNYATVGGGYDNTASGAYAMVAGGDGNGAINSYATVGGGQDNAARGLAATVGGGFQDTASGNYATVGGGDRNVASGNCATVGGGVVSVASGPVATVGGGSDNTASAQEATVGGGFSNVASGTYAMVGGGYNNTASGSRAYVGGGQYNVATDSFVTVGGGRYDSASAVYATVGGGYTNIASGNYATVGGGYDNAASATGATVAGGRYCDVAANYGFAVGNNSDVPSGDDNSAAFNGQTTTASGQTRVGALSKASGTFTIDHPLDPNGKILNHYFVESPDMSNVYSGSVVLNAAGRGEVRLPDYFDALNRNPRVQLTGVGTSDVYVAEKPAGNRFVVGGKPGTEVYWQVTGDRKDPSAEITRLIMPVEQPKTGGVAGRSLDDDFLRSTKDQLDRMGVGGQFDFRTADGRKRYEEMKRPAEKHGGEK